MIEVGDPLAWLAELPPADRQRTLSELPARVVNEIVGRWAADAHAGQEPPAGPWRVWLIRAGRGFGKTRAGAEWVWEVVKAIPDAQIALVGASIEDVVKVMIQGRSGLIATAPLDIEPRFWPGAATLTLGPQAVAHVYSAEAPEKLRGPEHHAAWCDELGKWKHGPAWGLAAFDNLMLGLRLGKDPRCVVTTTPRPGPLMKRVMTHTGTEQTTGRTQENIALPAAFVAAVEAEYAGTRLGRQELEGELLDDVVGALWTRALLAAAAVRTVDRAALVRVVVGVDPPASADGDACGIVACGVDADGTGWVLEDASVAGASPERWARAVADCAARHGADRVVAEKNNGGEMVRSVLLAAAAGLPVRLVHASRGKAARAEPVAALYERGRVKHVIGLGALEDELCGLVAGGEYAGPGRSPDRADACVWALTELMLGRRRGAAGIRTV